MGNNAEYKISIGTSDMFEDYIAEIHFPNKFGIIISQEKCSGNFEVSVHSFDPKASYNFDYNVNTDNKIELSTLEDAISIAKKRLLYFRRD